IPFMCASTAALLLLTQSSGRTSALTAGLMATVAFFTRGYAITFLPAGLVFYYQRRQWPISKRLKIFACFALPLIVGAAGWYGYARYVLLNERLDSITANYGFGSGIVLSV